MQSRVARNARHVPIDKQLICFYVATKHRRISTARRLSSVTSVPDMSYYETIVWEWHKGADEEKMLYGSDDSGTEADGTLEHQYELVRRILADIADMWR